MADKLLFDDMMASYMQSESRSRRVPFRSARVPADAIPPECNYPVRPPGHPPGRPRHHPVTDVSVPVDYNVVPFPFNAFHWAPDVSTAAPPEVPLDQALSVLESLTGQLAPCHSPGAAAAHPTEIEKELELATARMQQLELELQSVREQMREMELPSESRSKGTPNPPIAASAPSLAALVEPERESKATVTYDSRSRAAHILAWPAKAAPQKIAPASVVTTLALAKPDPLVEILLEDILGMRAHAAAAFPVNCFASTRIGTPNPNGVAYCIAFAPCCVECVRLSHGRAAR